MQQPPPERRIKDSERGGTTVRVSEVMTTDVLTARPTMTLKDVARVLAARGISGLPVVDDDRVLGVVSEADILAKERRPPKHQLGWSARQAPARRRKGEARTAGEAMTSPAVTVGPEYRVDRAAGLMLDCGINRLPVVDEDGRLVGIVTRADLVRAFASSDERIEREIRDEVLFHELWLDPRDFNLSVHEGAVTLVGSFADEEQREIVARRLRLVPGVVSVELGETVATR
jgi:CBS-domain-containing membrane protein